MRRLAGEALRFGATGLAATAAHMALYVALIEGAGLAPVVAAVLAVGGASSVTYLGQRFWVFRREAGGAAGIVRFALALGLAAALHAAILRLAMAGLGLGPYAGAALALCLVPPLSFLLGRAWVFRATGAGRG